MPCNLRLVSLRHSGAHRLWAGLHVQEYQPEQMHSRIQTIFRKLAASQYFEPNGPMFHSMGEHTEPE